MSARPAARPRVRALVLAAGFGTRLRPLTLTVPKPLLPVVGQAVAEHTLASLARVGCERAVLNLHHLGSQIEDQLGEQCHGIPLSYRPETSILGTLGPLAAARDHLCDADVVLLVNGDALCAWPFERLIRQHLESKADATLLVHGRIAAAAYGGGIGLGAEGRVVALRDDPPIAPVVFQRVFTGAHALHPRLLDALADGPGDIVADLYQPMLRGGATVRTVSTSRRWHDLGTPRRYLDGVLDWARGAWPRLLWRGNRVATGARVAADATVRRSVIENGVEVEAGARVERSVVLAGSRIGAGSRLLDCVIGPGVSLTNAHVEHRMVTVQVPGYNKAEDESILGALVYSPLAAP